MTVWAGVDVGNATTEVVLARTGAGTSDGVEVLATGRASTRRAKGSTESLAGAAGLVRRLERRHGVRVERVAAAPLRPVETFWTALPEEQPETGRLWVAAAGAGTAGGPGHGVGPPVPLGSVPEGVDPVVVIVPPGTGFRIALEVLGPLASAGRLAGVVIGDDEGVLVANRLPDGIPVVDEVDTAPLLAADLVAVEVAGEGRPLQVVTDALRLTSALRLSDAEREAAARVTALLFDVGNAVVAVGGELRQPSTGPEGWVQLRDRARMPFLLGIPAVRSAPVGGARAFALPPDLTEHEVDDLWSVDLASVAETVQARRGGPASRPVAVAALRSAAPSTDPAGPLAELIGVPVHTVTAESAAARAGALTTPGAGPGSAVVDLGAGTIDAVVPSSAVVAAGSGQLLTASVAALTGTTEAAAEWVKRGPARRVEAPQRLLGEDGSRVFLDRPATPESVGSLVVDGPAGQLPFSRTMAPGEWRALRLRLKTDLVGGNVARILRSLDAAPDTVVVVGGAAGDDEVLTALSGALPPGTAVGRGDVGGKLGHRYAVAYGLVLLAGSA